MLVWKQESAGPSILLGAVLAHAVQHHRHCPRGAVLSPQRRLQTALEVLQAVYADFARRQPTRLAALLPSYPGHRPGGDRDRGPTARPRRSARPSRGQWRGDADAGDAGGKTCAGPSSSNWCSVTKPCRPTPAGSPREAAAAAGRSLDARLDLSRQTTMAISALPLPLPDEPREPAEPPAAALAERDPGSAQSVRSRACARRSRSTSPLRSGPCPRAISVQSQSPAWAALLPGTHAFSRPSSA